MTLTSRLEKNEASLKPIVEAFKAEGRTPEELIETTLAHFAGNKARAYNTLCGLSMTVSEGWFGWDASTELFDAKRGNRAYRLHKMAATLLWTKEAVVTEKSFWPRGWGKGQWADPRTVAGR